MMNQNSQEKTLKLFPLCDKCKKEMEEVHLNYPFPTYDCFDCARFCFVNPKMKIAYWSIIEEEEN